MKTFCVYLMVTGWFLLVQGIITAGSVSLCEPAGFTAALIFLLVLSAVNGIMYSSALYAVVLESVGRR